MLLLSVSYFHLLARRRRGCRLALGQSAASFSLLGGVKPHTLDTYWAAAAGAAAVALRQVRGEEAPRRMDGKWERGGVTFKMDHNKGERRKRARCSIKGDLRGKSVPSQGE